MNRHMQDEAFEALLGSALRAEAAPAGLSDRINRAVQPRQPRWLMVMLSPSRLAACAGVLSLLLGFALGANSAVMADDLAGDMTVAVYAADDLGGL